MISLKNLPKVKLSSTESLFMNKGGFEVLTKNKTWRKMEFIGNSRDLKYFKSISQAAYMIKLLIEDQGEDCIAELYEMGLIRIVKSYGNRYCIATT